MTLNLWFEHCLLDDGWASRVRLCATGGVIDAIARDVEPQAGDERHALGLPGLPNLHSHAFQRAMAGLAETAGSPHDSFWSWRELMYRFLAHLDPDSFQAIAEQAYVEMLESGFTRVGEFHYLHHAADGRPHADPAEMSARVAAAAQASGIGLTLLPVFYAHADFGGAPPNPAQRRLIHDVEGFARLLEACRRALAPLPDAVLGIAPHSLRAATPQELAALLPLNDGPVHIHIAEQTREVEACLAWSGQRPVEWLLAHQPVDARWCLVHATHVTEAEWRGIIARGAVVGLCPITEANLGDGLFPMREFLAAGGRWGIGSDSHISVSPVEELRWLEYGQRLLSRHRNIVADAGSPSVGETLLRGVARSRARATGFDERDDEWIVLDADAPQLAGATDADIADRWIFSGNRPLVREVRVGGETLVAGGRHREREAIAARYREATGRLS